MAGCCGPRCSKTFVILYNILFWISGCAFVALGVFLLCDKAYSYMYHLLSPDPPTYPREIVDYVAYASIGVGGIILFVGFFGCCGALQESKCMLGTYIFFLILICFVEAALGLGTFWCWWKTEPGATKLQLKNIWAINYTVDTGFTEAFNHAQYSMKCCGIDSSNDYINNHQSGRQFNLPQNEPYPQTCCVLHQHYQDEDPWVKPNPIRIQDCQARGGSSNGSRYDKGCWEEILKWFRIYLLIIGASSGGLALLQIFGVLFSLCLIRNIGEEP